MKKSLIFAFVAVITLQLTSCLDKGVDRNNNELKAASSYLETKPDSTIVLTDVLLQKNHHGKKEDKMLLRILELRQQAFSRMVQIDSIVITGEKIREIAGRLNDSLSMAKSLLLVKGNVDFSHQQKMEPYFPPAIALFEREGKAFEKAKLSGTYGAILTGKGEFKTAQGYLLDAYSTFEKLDSIRQLYSVSLNIGSVYLEIGSEDKALEYFKKGKAVAQRFNYPIETASAMMNIGLVVEKKNPDSALAIYNEALNILPLSSNDNLRIKIKYNIADVEFKKGNITKAEQLYNEILDFSQGKNWYEGIAMARGALSRVYQSKREWTKALDQELQTAELFKSFGMGIELIRSRSNLLNIYESIGDHKAALQESKELKKLNDSILSIDKKVAIHEIESKYQSEKKETENEKLRSELQQRKFLLISLGILLLTLLVALYIYRQRNLFLRERNLSYEVLMKQYKEQMLEREHLGISSDLSPDTVTNLNTDSSAVILKHVNAASDHISDLTDEELTVLTNIERLIVDDKLYLNPKLKIEAISDNVGLTERIVSNIINRHYGVNFSQYVNRFRVEEARMLLERPDAMNLKLDAIGASAGFGSRQNFYTVFEQITGVNPGYYRNSIQNQQSGS